MLGATMRSVATFLLAALLATARGAAASDFDSLRALIEQHDIHSIEALLPLLPADQRAHNALLFHSRSLQAASFAAPRVLLFDNAAHFVLSFNGAPTQAGYLAIETMEFDATTKRFHFREIEFPADGRGKVEFREEARCLKCHGEPSRPIWDSYPHWPGAYGEREQVDLTGVERAQLLAFLSRQPSDPRYRILSTNEWQSRLAPIAAHGYEGHAPRSPNALLGDLLGKEQLQQLARVITAAPGYPAYRYALLGALDLRCSVEELLGAPLRDIWQREYPAFRKSTELANQAQAVLKQHRGADAEYKAPPAPPLDETEMRVRFLVERGLGISTREWTMALEKGTYDFRGAALAELEPLLAQEVSTTDLAFARLHVQRSSDDRYCAQLRRRSAPLTASATPRAPPQVETVRPLGLDACARCHDGEMAPAIAFDDSKEFTRALVTQQTARGPLINDLLYRLSLSSGADKMPRDSNLTEEERRQLVDYFLKLAAQAEEPPAIH